MPWTMRWVAGDVKATFDPGSTGGFTIIQVPAEEVYRLYSLQVERIAGATLTVSLITINDPRMNSNVTLKSPAAASVQVYDFLSNPLWIPSTFFIQVAVAAYGAGDTMRAKAFYEKWTKQ